MKSETFTTQLSAINFSDAYLPFSLWSTKITHNKTAAGLGLSFLCFAQAKCKKVQDLNPGVKKGSLSLSFCVFEKRKCKRSKI